MGKRGLGRGLSALISTGESVGGLKFEELPVTAVRPNLKQPRKAFSEEGIRELADSIREVGILQPLVVRSTESGFELIAGERRLQAAKVAGLDRVPVLIRQAGENESMELALVENLQREDLNPLETAAAYQALMEGFGLTKEQLARKLGKSRAAVTNTLRLARLPEKVQQLLTDSKITEGHARALLGIDDGSRVEQLAEVVVTQQLSVRDTEAMVRRAISGQMQTEHNSQKESGATKRTSESKRQQDMDEKGSRASQAIQETLSLPVRVKSMRRGGKVEIRFKTDEELEAIVALLTNGNPK